MAEEFSIWKELCTSRAIGKIQYVLAPMMDFQPNLPLPPYKRLHRVFRKEEHITRECIAGSPAIQVGTANGAEPSKPKIS
jgi:hypothetical protein